MSKYVCIAGNLAVGKTTLVKMLGRRPNWKPIYESIDSHPYINDFYSDPQRWAFHNQLYFLVESLRIQLTLSRSNGDNHINCQDFSIYDRHLYTEMMFEQGQMNERDYTTCAELFNLVLETGIKPDCIVYLKASPSTILKRLSTRGRRAESKVDIALIENLATKYDDWFLNRIESKVLVVNNEETDFTDDREVENLKNRIVRAIIC